jgi:hypothetical protein
MPKARKRTGRASTAKPPVPTVADVVQSLVIIERWVRLVRESLETLDQGLELNAPPPPFPRINPPMSKNC